ncbi:rhodanese-like domain-containing protein [Desulfococcus sp.]|uniref:rhodanese-like domain-containing protein n=1 Tax=Desulfococcus sp. TaxID=2025834 RepID=UPI003593C64C
MGPTINLAVKSALWQVPALVALAVLLAVGVNLWRSDGIPLVGDWSADARFSDDAGKSLVISLDEARGLFARRDVLFVDARPESEYAEGHIQGALSIPSQEADDYFMEAADRLSAAKAIITYCDGENCELSHDLALFLKEMGVENVRVLVNGWTVWHEAGLPTEGGY